MVATVLFATILPFHTTHALQAHFDHTLLYGMPTLHSSATAVTAAGEEIAQHPHFCLVIGWSANHHQEGMCMTQWLPNVAAFREVFFINMGVGQRNVSQLRAAMQQQGRTFHHHDPTGYMPGHAMRFERAHTGFKAIALLHLLQAGAFRACEVVWWADSSVRFSGHLPLTTPEQRPHPVYGFKGHINGFMHRIWAHPAIYPYFNLSRSGRNSKTCLKRRMLSPAS